MLINSFNIKLQGRITIIKGLNDINIDKPNVTDLINRIVQVLKEDLYWIRISAREAGLMEPVEPWDEG